MYYGGGLILGAGIVVEATCTADQFYRLGHGMLDELVGPLSIGFGDRSIYKVRMAAGIASLRCARRQLSYGSAQA